MTMCFTLHLQSTMLLDEQVSHYMGELLFRTCEGFEIYNLFSASCFKFRIQHIQAY